LVVVIAEKILALHELLLQCTWNVYLQERITAINVTDMLSLTEHQLHQLVTDCGASQDDTHRLVLAVSNLRHCIGWSRLVCVCWQYNVSRLTFYY